MNRISHVVVLVALGVCMALLPLVGVWRGEGEGRDGDDARAASTC